MLHQGVTNVSSGCKGLCDNGNSRYLPNADIYKSLNLRCLRKSSKTRVFPSKSRLADFHSILALFRRIIMRYFHANSIKSFPFLRLYQGKCVTLQRHLLEMEISIILSDQGQQISLQFRCSLSVGDYSSLGRWQRAYVSPRNEPPAIRVWINTCENRQGGQGRIYPSLG